MAKAQKNFLSGAMILTVAGLAVKVIGAIYKIPLANLITPTGMNYYNDAYQIYSLLYVLSTAGIPVAIAKMVSESIAVERLTEPKKILRISTSIFAVIGAALCVLLMLLVEPLSRLLSNETVNYCISMIAPAIFLVAVSATIKGYFQGHKCMTPTAVFQIIEALFKLAGLGLIGILLHRGITDPMILACGGVLGVTFGSFAATVFMVIRYLTEHDLDRNTAGSLPARSRGSLAKTILTLAIPISLSSSVMSIASTLDMFLVKWNLAEFGLSGEELLDVYGAYVGATSSLFNLPQALIIGIPTAVLPFLTSAFASGKKEEAYQNMRSSAKLVALIAMPCGLGMSALSEGIVKLLYTPAYWSVGIPTLTFLSFSVFFVSFVSLSGIYLQSIGKVKTTLMTMAIGAIMKITVNILAVRHIGIMGAPMGTLACYGSITLLNIFFICKYMGFKFPLANTFLKPAACSVISCALAFLTYKLLCLAGINVKLALFPAMATAVIAYAICLRLFKALTKEDMVFLPAKVGEFLIRKGWVHE